MTTLLLTKKVGCPSISGGVHSACETVLACDDGSTFADDFAVAGGISGNGVPTTPGTTSTPARDFAEQVTEHDDDAVSDDDEDPD